MSKDKKVHIKELRIEDLPLSCTMIWIGPPGSGKCLGKGTPVLMYDGNIKKVEDIKEGEYLMGDDSTPRRVLSTTSGRDNLYKIKPLKGEPYIVNEQHILCLKRNFMPRIKYDIQNKRYRIIWMKNNKEYSKLFNFRDYKSENHAYCSAVEFLNSLEENNDFTRENILEITVDEYLRLNKSIIKSYKGYRTGVNFSHVDVPFPYCLGYWLGSNYDSNFSINTINLKVVQRFTDELKKYGLNLRFEGNCKYKIEGDYFLNVLEEYKLINNKHIPSVYKCNSRENRLQLLAGIIDSHLVLFTSISRSLFEISHESKHFIDDVAFLVRSLGFTCEIFKPTPTENYYRLHFYGKNLHEIPVNYHSMNNPLKIDQDSLVEDIEVEPLGQGDYYGFTLDGNCRFLLGDFTVTHNTSGMETFAYRLKYRYPVGRIFIGTEDGYKKFSDIFHPLYVSNYYDENEEKNHILRQRTCSMENGKGYPGNYAINILDDISDDPKIFNTKVFQGLFKLGSQWWNQLCMVGLQYAIDMSPGIRKSVSYVAIGREPELKERKKLYENFGGMAGTFQDFCDLMDQLTGDFTFLVFKKRSQSNNIEDNVFYTKTEQIKPWKFGCREYREWANKRYDPNYVEEFRM
jgi:hypothetical protein